MSYKTTNDLMQHLRDNGIACLFPLIKSSMPPSNMILP